MKTLAGLALLSLAANAYAEPASPALDSAGSSRGVLEDWSALEDWSPLEDWATLSKDWEAALYKWADDWYTLWKQDQSAQFGPSPVPEFWDRFAALSAEGESRATLWMLWQLDQIGATPDVRKTTANELFERVKAAGDAAWVAEAIPALVRLRSALDDDALIDWFINVSGPTTSEGVRREAMLAHASFIDNPEWAFEMQVLAFADPGDSLGPVAELSTHELDEIAQVVEDVMNEGSSAHFQKWFVDLGDMNVGRPGAPTDPKDRLKPIVEKLAELGSPHAGLWCLANIWPTDDGMRGRLRGYLDRVSEAELDPDQLKRLSWYVSSLVSKVGAEPTEVAVQKMLPHADEETRPKLLASLGEGMCSNDATRERGLALLREVVEAYPDTDAAKSAAGKLFRFERLVVGKPAPDFDTVDVDGNAFKLSDYAGKVTVIDFWGFW